MSLLADEVVCKQSENSCSQLQHSESIKIIGQGASNSPCPKVNQMERHQGV